RKTKLSARIFATNECVGCATIWRIIRIEKKRYKPSAPGMVSPMLHMFPSCSSRHLVRHLQGTEAPFLVARPMFPRQHHLKRSRVPRRQCADLGRAFVRSLLGERFGSVAPRCVQ